MPQTPRRIIVKDGKKVEVIEPEEIEPEWDGPQPSPSWKHLKNRLILGDLNDATKSVKEQLNRIRQDLPPEVKHIMRGYLAGVDHILVMYEHYDSVGGSGGPPTKHVQRGYAKNIVLEYQKAKKDSTKYPTGSYLFERLEEIKKTLPAESHKSFTFSLRSCDGWIAAMKDGTFDPPPLEDFF